MRYVRRKTVLGAKQRLPPIFNVSGSIKPETGGDNLSFEKSAFSWDITATPPKAGQRLSYEVGTNSDNKPCALNLETI